MWGVICFLFVVCVFRISFIFVIVIIRYVLLLVGLLENVCEIMVFLINFENIVGGFYVLVFRIIW